MTLDEFPDVALSESPWFIVAELEDEGKKKRVVYSCNIRSHVAVFADLKKQLDLSIKAKCLGGGFIRILDLCDEKEITLYGSSLSYGEEPDRAETVRMIQAAYPDFTVEAR